MLATVTPNADTGSVMLICEPEAGAWSDWFRVDDGTNLENAEAIARAITRRVAARRRGEQAEVRADRDREGTHRRQAQPAACAGRAALPLQHAGQRAVPDPQRPGAAPTQMLGQPDPVPAPFAAAHRASAVHARRGTRTRAAPTSRSSRSAWVRACSCRSTCPSTCSTRVPGDDAADAGRERDQARPGAAHRRRHRVDPARREATTAWRSPSPTTATASASKPAAPASA